MLRPSAKITTTTIPYINPDAMVHVLLMLNEPLLQCIAHVAPSVCPSPQTSLASGSPHPLPNIIFPSALEKKEKKKERPLSGHAFVI